MAKTASKTGLGLKTYENGATAASPSWTEVTAIVNESLDFDKTITKNKNRSSEWERAIASHKMLSGSFTYQENLNDTDATFDNLWDSYLNDTIFEWAFMDGDIATTGNKGFRAGILVTKLTMKRELEGVREWDVTFELAEFIESGALVEPSRYEVPA